MPIAYCLEERANLLRRKRVRLLLGVGHVRAGVEPLDFDDGVLREPELVNRLVHDAPEQTQPVVHRVG